MFPASWLEVSPCWVNGAVGHRWGLPPADGGHPPRDRQLCPPVLRRPCKETAAVVQKCHSVYLTVLMVGWSMFSRIISHFLIIYTFFFFLLPSTQGCGMPPAMLLDKWPQTLPPPSKRNSMIRYLKWLKQLCKHFHFLHGYKDSLFIRFRWSQPCCRPWRTRVTLGCRPMPPPPS